MFSLLDFLPPDNGTAEGERRRDESLNRLRARRPALVRRLQRAFLRHLLTHGASTSDPVRALVPIPKGIDPRVVGSAVRALATDYGLIAATGERQKSRRAKAHARKLDVWAVRDRAAVECWLFANTELPDDPTPPTHAPDYVI